MADNENDFCGVCRKLKEDCQGHSALVLAAISDRMATAFLAETETSDRLDIEDRADEIFETSDDTRSALRAYRRGSFSLKELTERLEFLKPWARTVAEEEAQHDHD